MLKSVVLSKVLVEEDRDVVEVTLEDGPTRGRDSQSRTKSRVNLYVHVIVVGALKSTSVVFVLPAKHSGTKGSLCPASVCPCVCPIVTLSW